MANADGINPLHQEPNYVMFGPGAGTSHIVHRETRKPIPAYEPMLIIRASDTKAPHALRAWSDMLAGEDPKKSRELREQAEKMAAFQSQIAKV